MKYLARFVFRILYKHVACRRPPDQVIGRDHPYLIRWWLFGADGVDENGDPRARRILGQTLYLHCFIRSDDDRALHDHPANYTTWILRNGYEEVTDEIVHKDLKCSVVQGFDAGQVRSAKAEDAHRVQLYPRTGDNIAEALLVINAVAGRISCEQQITTVGSMVEEIPAWTLFWFGKKWREWGFLCPQGWVHWRTFDANNGCGEA